MNRAQRRLQMKQYRKMGLTQEQSKTFANNYKYTVLKEGDRVKLNYEFAIRCPEWKLQKDEFKEWFTAHKDETFTVETVTDGGLQVTFVEDNSDPKWVLHTATLIPIATATIKLDNGETTKVDLDGVTSTDDPKIQEVVQQKLDEIQE